MDPSEKKHSLRIVDEAAVAVGRHIFQHTVCFVDREKSEVASGTLVKIGCRLLVATAGHCVPPSPSGRLWFVRRTMHPENGPTLAILSHAKIAFDGMDVGVLELDAQSAPDFLQQSPISLDQIADLGAGRDGRPAILVGSRAADVTTSHDSSGTPVHRFDTSPFIGIGIGDGSWPEIPEDAWSNDIGTNPDTDRDVLLEYHQDDGFEIDTQTNKDLGHPGGMSGGGIWDQGFYEKETWSPDRARLMGIQTHRFRHHPYLRGIQIRHWLRLVHSVFPDLRPQLEESFPGVGA